MDYSISEAAEKMGLTVHTLRYYDKEGLLPFLVKTAHGKRIFREADFEWLGIIECLKATGMSLKDIRQFIDWCLLGDDTLQERYDLFKERKIIVEKQLNSVQKMLEIVNYKCWYYETAVSAGTEKIHQDLDPQLCPHKPSPYGLRTL